MSRISNNYCYLKSWKSDSFKRIKILPESLLLCLFRAGSEWVLQLDFVNFRLKLLFKTCKGFFETELQSQHIIQNFNNNHIQIQIISKTAQGYLTRKSFAKEIFKMSLSLSFHYYKIALNVPISYPL